jgi:hypothetical protein
MSTPDGSGRSGEAACTAEVAAYGRPQAAEMMKAEAAADQQPSSRASEAAQAVNIKVGILCHPVD